jgi:hypothetical protein
MLAAVLSSCTWSSGIKDMQPIIDGRFKTAKAIYYPSSDYKVSAVIVDSSGNVWFIRLNADAEVKDDKQLFNVFTYCR